jgi:pyrroloquinoline quinone (PQQ) biosynthesis protein C
MNEAALDRIRGHRFVADAHEGRLDRSQVVRWLMCAGRESRTFPDILDNMIKTVSEPLIVRVLRENLDDEYGNGDLEQAHFRHYLTLLDQIGISESTFNAYQERAGIRLALDLALNVSLRQDVEVAIGYMLVNEGMTPITYGAVEVAAKEHFPELSTSFFQLHVEVDEHHVEQLYTAAAALSDDALDGLAFGVALGERGMAVLLDEALGVYEPAAETDR